MFAHEHAEHGRLRRIFVRGLSQVYSGRAHVCRHIKAQVFTLPPHGQEQRVLFRHLHFVDASALQPGLKFVCQRVQRDGVKRHCQSSEIFPNNSFSLLVIPCRYSQPNRASSPVAAWYWARSACCGTEFTRALRPRLYTAASPGVSISAILAMASAWAGAFTRLTVRRCRSFTWVCPAAHSMARVISSYTPSPTWARPSMLMAFTSRSSISGLK